MKYFLVDDGGEPITDKEQTRRIGIRHEDGTMLIDGLGNDRLTPFTEDRAKLDEMIALANLAASEQKHIVGLFSGAEDRQRYLDSVAKEVK